MSSALDPGGAPIFFEIWFRVDLFEVDNHKSGNEKSVWHLRHSKEKMLYFHAAVFITVF